MLFRKKEKNELDIIGMLTEKDRIKRYTFLVVGCFLTAVAFNLFFEPYSLVTGGVSGISIIINKVFGVSTTTFIVISYIFLLILSYFVLGKDDTKHTLMGSILYPLFVYLTRNIGTVINFNVDNMLLVVLFGAVIHGLGSGLTFKYGFSTGGSDIIVQILAKELKISIGDAIKFNNMLIILGAGFFIGDQIGIYAFENVMYALIIVYIVSVMNDKLLLGISSSKSFYIITDNETSIKSFLINELKSGVTVLEGRGGYTGDRKKVLMCVIPTKNYFLARDGILELDPNAIILINDVYQSTGIE